MGRAHDIRESQASRRAALAELYAARVAKPRAGWRWKHTLESAVGAPLDFELSYLTERGLVRQDGSRYRITALGIDAYEQEI